MVVAYVMAVTELSCQEVLDAIRTVRPVANPNPGFRQQLAEFGSGAARKVGPASATPVLPRQLSRPTGLRARTSPQGPGCCPAPLAAGWDLPLGTGTLVCFSLLRRSAGT